MTHVHFEYSDAYGSGSRGSFAFTPHRRHASNETEVLPKPFTVPLLNGEVTVDLRPNPSTWVWIITEYFEQNAESFYTTIPDSDGVVEAVDLIRINPSTIPAPYNAVEPVWWAEMRQYKQTVTDTLLQSEEALTEAKEAIEIGSESIEQTQHNASLAKAYANESRESSYESREYRDEAEQWRDEAQEQADRAASGPESAAQRAEDAAESASNSETATRGFRDEARDSASDARSSETSASGSASTATERASDARNEANRSESEATRAQGYADELMDGPREYVEQTEAAKDEAISAKKDAEEYASLASKSEAQSKTYAERSDNAADAADISREQAQTIADNIQPEDFVDLDLINEWTAYAPETYNTPSARKTPHGIQLRGVVTDGSHEHIATLPEGLRPENRSMVSVTTGNNTIVRLSIYARGDLILGTLPEGYVSLDGIVISD